MSLSSLGWLLRAASACQHRPANERNIVWRLSVAKVFNTRGGGKVGKSYCAVLALGHGPRANSAAAVAAAAAALIRDLRGLGELGAAIGGFAATDVGRLAVARGLV